LYDSSFDENIVDLTTSNEPEKSVHSPTLLDQEGLVTNKWGMEDRTTTHMSWLLRDDNNLQTSLSQTIEVY